MVNKICVIMSDIYSESDCSLQINEQPSFSQASTSNNNNVVLFSEDEDCDSDVYEEFGNEYLSVSFKSTTEKSVSNNLKSDSNKTNDEVSTDVCEVSNPTCSSHSRNSFSDKSSSNDDDDNDGDDDNDNDCCHEDQTHTSSSFCNNSIEKQVVLFSEDEDCDSDVYEEFGNEYLSVSFKSTTEKSVSNNLKSDSNKTNDEVSTDVCEVSNPTCSSHSRNSFSDKSSSNDDDDNNDVDDNDNDCCHEDQTHTSSSFCNNSIEKQVVLFSEDEDCDSDVYEELVNEYLSVSLKSTTEKSVSNNLKSDSNKTNDEVSTDICEVSNPTCSSHSRNSFSDTSSSNDDDDNDVDNNNNVDVDDNDFDYDDDCCHEDQTHTSSSFCNNSIEKQVILLSENEDCDSNVYEENVYKYLSASFKSSTINSVSNNLTSDSNKTNDELSTDVCEILCTTHSSHSRNSFNDLSSSNDEEDDDVLHNQNVSTITDHTVEVNKSNKLPSLPISPITTKPYFSSLENDKEIEKVTNSNNEFKSNLNVNENQCFLNISTDLEDSNNYENMVTNYLNMTYNSSNKSSSDNCYSNNLILGIDKSTSSKSFSPITTSPYSSSLENDKEIEKVMNFNNGFKSNLNVNESQCFLNISTDLEDSNNYENMVTNYLNMTYNSSNKSSSDNCNSNNSILGIDNSTSSNSFVNKSQCFLNISTDLEDSNNYENMVTSYLNMTYCFSNESSSNSIDATKVNTSNIGARQKLTSSSTQESGNESCNASSSDSDSDFIPSKRNRVSTLLKKRIWNLLELEMINDERDDAKKQTTNLRRSIKNDNRTSSKIKSNYRKRKYRRLNPEIKKGIVSIDSCNSLLEKVASTDRLLGKNESKNVNYNNTTLPTVESNKKKRFTRLDFFINIHWHYLVRCFTKLTDIKFDANSEIDYSCVLCNLRFANFNKLSIHMVRVHEGTVTDICNKCGLSFCNITDFNEHVNEMHSLSTDDNKSVYCYICSTHCDDFDYDFLRHLKEDHKFNDLYKFKCELCSLFLVNEYMLKNHRCFFCDVCKNYTASNLQNYKHHLLKHVKLHIFKCTYCDKTFQTRRGCKYHISIKHMSDKKLPFVCDKCNKSFLYKNMLNEHINRCHNNIIYCCDNCDNKYFTKYTLKYHQRKCHRNTTDDEDLNFICNFCDLNVNRKALIIEHLDYDSCICNWCNLSLRCLTELNNHIYESHTKSNNVLKCTHCDFDNITSLSHYKRHLILKHPQEYLAINKNAVKCNKCDHVCSSKHHLKKHERVSCLKNFTASKINKRRNVKLCEYCDHIFQTKSSLIDHFNNINNTCTLCDSKFNCNTLYMDHLKNTHNLCDNNNITMVKEEFQSCDISNISKSEIKFDDESVNDSLKDVT